MRSGIRAWSPRIIPVLIAAGALALSFPIPATALCAADLSPIPTGDPNGVVFVGTAVETRTNDYSALFRVEEVWLGGPLPEWQPVIGAAPETGVVGIVDAGRGRLDRGRRPVEGRHPLPGDQPSPRFDAAGRLRVQRQPALFGSARQVSPDRRLGPHGRAQATPVGLATAAEEQGACPGRSAGRDRDDWSVGVLAPAKKRRTESGSTLAPGPRLTRQRFHDLRLACATLQLDAGADLFEMSRALGYASITTTANVYAQWTSSMAERTAV